jgi:hypothetical protein
MCWSDTKSQWGYLHSFIKKAIAYLENPFSSGSHLHTENCHTKNVSELPSARNKTYPKQGILKVYYPWYLGIFSNCRYIGMKGIQNLTRLGSVEDDMEENVLIIFNSYIKSVKILVYARIILLRHAF